MIKSILKLPSVTDEEERCLLKYEKFKHLFEVLYCVTQTSIWPFDTSWMITSIDRNWPDSTLRDGSHQRSQAVDIVPVTEKDSFRRPTEYVISLPIPLNRNFLLAKTLQSIIDHSLKLPYNRLPFIALEADHIHADVLHPGGLIMYNQLRSLADRNKLIDPYALKSLDDKSWTKIF